MNDNQRYLPVAVAAMAGKGMEVPFMSTDSIIWVDMSIPSDSDSVDSPAFAPPSQNAASCTLIPHGDTFTYVIWRIHVDSPHVLEILELSACKELPKIGLRIKFPDALSPFAFIFKYESSSDPSHIYMLYALTVSGVSYLFKLRNFSTYASCSTFPHKDLINFDLKTYHNRGPITTVAATAGRFIVGWGDGSVSSFQLGLLDQNSPNFMHDFRDDAGIGRLWTLVSRNRTTWPAESLIVSEVHGKELVFTLQLDGTLRIWDVIGHNRLFIQTVSTSSSAGFKYVRLWVGQANSEKSKIPIAIQCRLDQEVSTERVYVCSIHYSLGDRINFSLDPSFQDIPIEEGELIDVKLDSENIWILKEDGLISHKLFHSGFNVEEVNYYSLQEAFVADQLFQSAEHSSDELLWICQSVVAKEKIIALLSSIFLQRLLQPGVYDCYVLRSMLQDYNRHWTDAEIQSLTIDGVKKEIISVLENEGASGSPISAFYCWKSFFSRYFHYWCRNSTLYCLLIESSCGAVGLIRKQSLSLFRCLENIEMLCDGSLAEVNETTTSLFDFCSDECDREVFLDVLQCASTMGQQLGKVAPVIVYESLVNPLISSSVEITPSLLRILESGYSSSVTVAQMSDIGSDIVWEKQLVNHKNLRKFSIEMLLSLSSLYRKASTWDRILTVIKNYMKHLVPQRTCQASDSEIIFAMSTSIAVLATSQMAKLMFESASDMLLFLNYLHKTSEQIHMSDGDVSRLQLELVPMILEITMEWALIHFLATTSSENPPLSDFSYQLSSLQIDGNTDKRLWNERLGKCDFSLAHIIFLNIWKSSGSPTSWCLPNPQNCVNLVHDFTSWVICGQSGKEPSSLFSHSANVAVILLRHRQYNAVENLLTIVDMHSRKEKTCESIQDTEGAWCARLHLLGCCLLAQACTLHGMQKERKISEAVRCFFRASSGEGASKALQSLSNEIGVLYLNVVECESFVAWKLRYYQWAMQIFEQYGLSGGACQFALAALEQVDEARVQEKDGSDQDSLIETTTTMKGRLWANVFKFSLDQNHYFDAYCAIITNPDVESKYICLRRFVIVLYERGARKILCNGQLPFIGLSDKVEKELAWKAERSDISDRSNTYKLLYAFETHRHNWRKAASYLYLYSVRLKTEMTSTNNQYQSLMFQERMIGLSAAINALHLVHPACAWIDPLSEEYSLYNEHYPIKRTRRTVDEQSENTDQTQRLHSYADVDKLEKEYVLTSAEYFLFKYNVKWTYTGTEKLPSDLVVLLIQKDLYDMGITVILKFWKGSGLKRELERVFYAMALKCCTSPNKVCSPVVRDDFSAPRLVLTSSLDEVVARHTPDLDSNQHLEGNSQWETLQLYLKKYRSFNARLPVVVAETLLQSNRHIQLPLWLVNMFKVDGTGKLCGMTGQEASPASLLRIYVDYGQYTEATHMLLDYMKSYSAVRPADIIRRKRSSAVWLPYATIELLLCELDRLMRMGHMVDQCDKLKGLLLGGLQNHLNLVKVDSEDALACAVSAI